MDAKAGMLFGGLLKFSIPLMVALPGLCAIILVPTLGDANADRAVPEMIRLFMPAGLRGLMFAALFAAMMSHISASLNSTTTIFITDIIGQLRKWSGRGPLGEQSALRWGRYITAIMIISTALLAEPIGNREHIYVYMQTILSMFQGPLLAILLLGILCRATGHGGFWGLVSGLGCSLFSTTRQACL